MSSDTKDRILEKALEMFSIYGYRGTNLRDLASSLELSKSALYRHFNSKDDIFNTLVARLEVYYAEHFGSETNLPPVPANTEELKALTFRMVRFTVHDEKIRMIRKFFSMEQFRNSRAAALSSKHFLETQERIFSALFKEMMRAGLLQENDPETLSLAYTAPITAMIHLCDREPGREAEAFAKIENHMDLFIRTYGTSAPGVCIPQNTYGGETRMKELDYITLRSRPQLEDAAAEWFRDKWNVPKEAYLECMDAYLNHETEYGWYLCLDGDRIVAGLGVIENDFHERKDLTPNICAVYTEEEYRCRGIAGQLLDMAVADLKSKGITPVYLLTDHTGFYERYGWEFLCMVRGDDEPELSRMYVHN